MKTLLVGMGNPLLGDDAVGVRLARDCKQKLGGTGDLEVIEECTAYGLDLIELFRGFERVVILDSARGSRPGSWYRTDARSLASTVHLMSIHDANLATALELGRRLGVPLPDDAEILIFAVEVEDSCTFSERMTPVMENAYPEYAEAILLQVREVLAA